MKRTIAAATLLLAVVACAERPAVRPTYVAAVEVEEPEWRTIASPDDQKLLNRIADIWKELSQRTRRSDRRLIASEGALLIPDAARDHPLTPPGSYRCRLIRLEPPSGRGPMVRTFPDFFCNVASDEGGHLAFAKQTGTELPSGWLYPDNDRRWILIGAKQDKPDENAIAYGAASERNVIGIVERVAPFRWRLVLPRRGDKPALDIYELTPLPLEQQAPEER